MSGNVVAWVFAHYPVNGLADKNRKVVLAEVAQAANKDFTNAHPGVATIAAHWRFDPGTVRRHLTALVEDGWLEVTERGSGPGHATTFRVCEERAGIPTRESAQYRPPKARNLNGQSAQSEPAKARNPNRPKRAIPRSTPITHPRDTPLENTFRSAHADEPQLDGMPETRKSQRETDSVVGTAHTLVERVFRDRKPRPLPSFLNVRALAVQALRCEWAEADVEAAMMAPDCVFTTAGLQVARAKLTQVGRGRDRDLLGGIQAWMQDGGGAP